MKRNRKKSITVGLLILVAYGILGTNNPNARTLGMFLEIISGLAVISIAILMFPLLKPYGKKLSFYYLALKGFEGSLMIVAGVLFFVHTSSLLSLRDLIYLVHGYIFAIPALIFYFLLYKSKHIPKWMSVWGVIASILLIIVNLLELIGITLPLLKVLYLPIVLNEIVLAIWLIVYGFDIPVMLREKDSLITNR